MSYMTLSTLHFSPSNSPLCSRQFHAIITIVFFLPLFFFIFFLLLFLFFPLSLFDSLSPTCVAHVYVGTGLSNGAW